ncbi:MAG: site-2 protease family protein [Patescibacteria group bacterium]
MGELQLAIFQIVVLIFSAVIHEVSHGAVANHLGDPTAKDLGRLTLNPVKHLELFGSIILPVLLYLSKVGFIFGWAKPVPYNPANLKDPRWGSAWIALAGPAANLAVALVLGLIIRFASIPDPFFVAMLEIVVFINILLAVFNLVPIPPLDGSKLLFSALGERAEGFQRMFEQNGLIVLLLFIFFGFTLILPIIYFLFWAITGNAF